MKISMLEASMNLMCNYIPSVAGQGARVPRLGRAHAQVRSAYARSNTRKVHVQDQAH